MQPLATSMIRSSTTGRAILARKRARWARDLLADCQLCGHRCGVNRLVGETGFCNAGLHARCFQAQTEVCDEPELAPCFGIAFGGCDLRCDFCVSGAESWNAAAPEPLDASALARRATDALQSGARSIMILGGEPTIHVHHALAVVGNLSSEALLVWKTNAHGTEVARLLLDGMFDVWVADYKFGNDACALRMAHIRDYTRVVRENLRWAVDRTRLIVRHLVMPGHLECCWRPVASWLAEQLPGATVSLRGGFWPGWHSHRHPELGQTTTDAEWKQAERIAHEHGLCPTR